MNCERCHQPMTSHELIDEECEACTATQRLDRMIRELKQSLSALTRDLADARREIDDLNGMLHVANTKAMAAERLHKEAIKERDGWMRSYESVNQQLIAMIEERERD